jgi:hypothetical protein
MGLSFDDVEMKIVFRLQKDGAATPDVIAGELKQPTAGVMVCLKELQKEHCDPWGYGCFCDWDFGWLA